MWRKAKRCCLGGAHTRQWLLYICALFIFLCHVALHYNTSDEASSSSSSSSASAEKHSAVVERGLRGKAVDGLAESDHADPSKGLALMSNVTKLDSAGGTGTDSFNRPSQTARYQYNCSNIHHITVKRKLGHGVSKQVYLGEHQGQKVAVKMVTRNALDVTACIKKKERESTYKLEEKPQCYIFPNMKLMKEILLLEQLSHPNLMKMLGYCVRSEETESTALEEHGVVAIHEYALTFYMSTIVSWPFKMRIKTAIELTDLLDYLEHSPLGSLLVADFKDSHFLLKDGRIKLTDMDDVSSSEPNCEPRKESSVCELGLQCVGGICPGWNAKKNLENMHKLFYKEILFSSSSMKGVDKHSAAILSDLKTRLEDNTITARELKTQLYTLLDVPYIPGYS